MPAAREVARVEPVGVPPQHLHLVAALGQREDDLEEEAVELGLGQGVGALVLDGVLRRGDHEGGRQRVRLAVDADLALLHRLEQGRLRLGGRAVDLVGEQEVGEDRPGPEGEVTVPGVEDERAGEVAGHEVGGELHPLGPEVERRGEAAHEERLGDAGHALEEDVAPAQQGHEQPGDGGVLPDDGLGHLRAHREQGGAGARGVGGFGRFGGFGRRGAPGGVVVSWSVMGGGPPPRGR